MFQETIVCTGVWDPLMMDGGEPGLKGPGILGYILQALS